MVTTVLHLDRSSPITLCPHCASDAHVYGRNLDIATKKLLHLSELKLQCLLPLIPSVTAITLQPLRFSQFIGPLLGLSPSLFKLNPLNACWSNPQFFARLLSPILSLQTPSFRSIQPPVLATPSLSGGTLWVWGFQSSSLSRVLLHGPPHSPHPLLKSSVYLSPLPSGLLITWLAKTDTNRNRTFAGFHDVSALTVPPILVAVFNNPPYRIPENVTTSFLFHKPMRITSR